MKPFPFILTALLCYVQGHAQLSYPENAANTYASPSNTLYWKNRPPCPGYWQQDIHYQINASLDYLTGIVTGEEQLTYTNNSPDTLYEVYFHLYQNAFQPGSYLHHLSLANKENPRYGRYESQRKGTEILSLSSGTGNNNVKEIIPDNTILRVKLKKPILPATSEVFRISFKTYFDAGGERRRMKQFRSSARDMHYDLVHWYPRICVYDRKFGWETDQHLGKEFYGDYGAFDVNFTIASHYILDGTGVMVNESEMLPPALRKALDIKNFADSALGRTPNEIIKPDGETKTWKFHAENVHDFALTMDPTYRIAEVKTQSGVRCIALAQESNAPKWQDAAGFTARVIDIYSRDFGPYAYPKMIVADARDGMEYPMLTLDGGLYPGYHFVIAHEVGHNWFFGMVGNNETYRAALDEGFTQYLTAWSLTRIDGDYPLRDTSNSGYYERFYRPVKTNERTIFLGYISDAMNHNDPRLNTHSDDFNSALGHGGGYGHVYYKTATMLANLQYVLGDELFTKAMIHYFNQWKFAHPYFEDFRNSIIQYTHTDLNWFFDQWMETTKTLDYAVKKPRYGGHCKNKPGEDCYTYLLRLERKGEMQSPIDLTVKLKNGQVKRYHIPNTYFVKVTDTTAVTVLPAWKGWGRLNTIYETAIDVPSHISEVIIDTTQRLADVYALDNRTKPRTRWAFDSQVAHTPDRNRYVSYIRPDIWYNSVDGIKAGINLNGNYYNRRHIYDISLWYNTGFPADRRWTDNRNLFSVWADYKDAIGKNLYWNLGGKYLDGLLSFYSGLEKQQGNDKYSLMVKTLYRAETTDLNYLLYPELWNAQQQNNSLNLAYEHRYRYTRGNGNIMLGLRTPFLWSDYNYSAVTARVTNQNNLGRLEVRTRAFGQWINGGNIAPESQLYMAGANPEELMDSKYTRSQGFVPEDWTGYGNVTNHFQQGGGLNLRGYAGYLGWTDNQGTSTALYRGNGGFSGSIEADLDGFIRINAGPLSYYFHIDAYLFADAGMLFGPGELASPFRTDAGLGTALTIKPWWPLQKVRPLTIRFDMPFFLSNPPYEEDYVKFRWVLGIGRSF